MEIDNIKECWKDESKRISENVNINRKVSFQKLHSSFNKIKVWRLIRIVQWCVVVPFFFVLIIPPHIKNDGSILFYVAFVLLILIMISFCISYIYHYLNLSKIDLTEPISKVQKKIYRLEILDKRIYIFRFISMMIAFLCAFKIFGTPSIEPGKMTIIALIIFIMIYTLIVRLRFQIPKEYTQVKSCLDEMENEEEKD